MADKAYGIWHQRTRAGLLLVLAERWAQHRADPVNCPAPTCPRCGEPLLSWQPVDLGHTHEADKLAGRPGDRLEHSSCNREAGASKTSLPKGYEPSRQW